VWFDNGRSTGLKIEAASKAGVLGVGAWPVDNIDWTNQSQVRQPPIVPPYPTPTLRRSLPTLRHFWPIVIFHHGFEFV